MVPGPFTAGGILGACTEGTSQTPPGSDQRATRQASERKSGTHLTLTSADRRFWDGPDGPAVVLFCAAITRRTGRPPMFSNAK